LKGSWDVAFFGDFTWRANELEQMQTLQLGFWWNGTGKSAISEIVRRPELRHTPKGEHIQLACVAVELSHNDFANSNYPIKAFMLAGC